jgi:hypothetical protein
MGRFKLMGYQVEGADANASTVSLEQQHAEEEHASTIVYETDDQVEARAIMNAGGFFRDRDNFVTVTQVVDSQAPERDQPDTPFFRPSTFPQKGN